MKLLTFQLLERMREVDLKTFDEKLAPDQKVVEGERVIGVLPDHLKRLWIAILTTANEIVGKCGEIHDHFASIVKDGKTADDVSKEELLNMEIHSVGHQWVIEMNDLFWVEVSNVFPELSLGMPGLRDRWTVVLKNPTQISVPVTIVRL